MFKFPTEYSILFSVFWILSFYSEVPRNWLVRNKWIFDLGVEKKVLCELMNYELINMNLKSQECDTSRFFLFNNRESFDLRTEIWCQSFLTTPVNQMRGRFFYGPYK